MTAAVAVFLETPRTAAVKMTLAADVGERHALRLYRIMASRTLAAVRGAGLDGIVWFTPTEAGPELRFWLGEGWDLRPQASGDFGARLTAAEHAVPRGRTWLAIGTEYPRLDSALLRDAAAIAEGGEVVLGPGEHGGCYLVGGRTPLPDVFGDLPWGTGRLLALVRARLARLGATWRELTVLRAVDSASDARAEGLLT